MPPDVRVAFDRLKQLQAEAAQVSNAEAERFRAFAAEDVSREAPRVMAELEERARINGYAEALTATEDDDWVKLEWILEHEGAASIGGPPAPMADRWSRQMAAHARRRTSAHDSVG
jgi:hypothetical protein